MELEEIEKHLRNVDLVREGVVVPADRNGQTVMLAAYVVLRDTPASKLENTIAIKKALSENLPAYMIPQKIVIMEHLPRNTNGKVDRTLLKEQSSLH